MNTRANAASINSNYTQPFIEWLARQPADNATGHIGRDGAALMIAKDPKQAMAYSNKFLAQESLIPKAVLHTNPDKIKADYQAERGYQKYPATQDSLNTVKQQGDSLFTSNVSSQGAQFRSGASQTVDETHQGIAQGSSGISQESSTIQQKVETEQGRSVTIRMGKKVLEESRETVSDLKNLGNGTSDVLRILEPGGPQQK